jgi:hypothetical protein
MFDFESDLKEESIIIGYYRKYINIQYEFQNKQSNFLIDLIDYSIFG